MTDLLALAQYRFEGKSEQAVREEWIRPLLVHLGYGIETLNEVRYESVLPLAAPFRRIGRTRMKVDYVPTVLGHGLWIIEAKAHGGDDWDEAISQAWLYATHPEIDVPFMVIADGSRIAVYDVNEPDWQNPVIEIPTPELARRFPELAEVLGAAHVTSAVRKRRMRHLGAAMKAELSGARLHEYVTEVQELASEAQSAVGENERAILRDQFAREETQRQEAVSEAGLFAIGIWVNQPFPLSREWAEKAIAHVKSLPPAERSAELQRLLDAASYGSPQNGPRQPRMFWMLRATALEVSLALRDDEGCGEQARELARGAMRDHLLNFPDDPVARAAHRIEKALPAFVLRSFLTPGGVDLAQVAREIQQDWGDEKRLRERLDGDRLLIDRTTELTQALWSRLPWTASSLEETATAIENALANLEYRTDGASGPAGDPYLEFARCADDLRIQALDQLIRHFDLDLIDEDIEAALVEFAETDEGIDERFVRSPARTVLELIAAARAAS